VRENEKRLLGQVSSHRFGTLFFRVTKAYTRFHVYTIPPPKKTKFSPAPMTVRKNLLEYQYRFCNKVCYKLEQK